MNAEVAMATRRRILPSDAMLLYGLWLPVCNAVSPSAPVVLIQSGIRRVSRGAPWALFGPTDCFVADALTTKYLNVHTTHTYPREKLDAVFLSQLDRLDGNDSDLPRSGQEKR